MPLAAPRNSTIVRDFVPRQSSRGAFVARPGAKEYGALSVLTAARAEARLLGRLGPGAFRPPPKVESASVPSPR